MVRFGGPTFDGVGDTLNPGSLSLAQIWGRLRNEGRPPAVAFDKLGGDVAELGGKVLMDEEDVHGRFTCQDFFL